MPKANILFNLPEEASEFEVCMKAADMRAALTEIHQELLRPARKHGYNNRNINELIQSIGEDKANELIGELEVQFFKILNARNLGELV